MHLVLLCHPRSLGSTSMPRFARLVGEGMRERGHSVEYWASPHLFGRLPVPKPALRKWLGYVDQFLVFPLILRFRAALQSAETVFVVTDQALGMWVPAICRRPHVIHCHDFLAQRSALGEFPENPTGWSGRKYQSLIRRGYRRGRFFISVSARTREDLHRFLGREPEISEVVYNPLNHPFAPLPREEALSRLGALATELAGGYWLHVGGDQWYKNRPGVLAIYRAYCARVASPKPMLMVGKSPNAALRAKGSDLSNGGRVIFACSFSDQQVQAAYSAATALLFPSLEEGFGWPIAEAQACGCPVVTTEAAPMNEVGATAARYIPRCPTEAPSAFAAWASAAAETLVRLEASSAMEREALRAAGLENVKRFAPEAALSRIEKIYQTLPGSRPSKS